jgi:hypothetical protein
MYERIDAAIFFGTKYTFSTFVNPGVSKKLDFTQRPHHSKYPTTSTTAAAAAAVILYSWASKTTFLVLLLLLHGRH